MKKFFKILIFILAFAQSNFAQTFNSNLVSKKTELNFAFTKMRGIKSEKVIYFVENDLQTISAYRNGKLKWKTNIISVCGEPSVGKSEIRYMKLEAGKLFITYGKHNFAELDTGNGNAKYLGKD
jgi:hypothetical protein